MKKIPSIVIGSGFGKRVIANLINKNKKFELIALVTRNNFKKVNFKKAKIIFLATPPHTHHWWINKIPTGSKIVCEKPLSNNLANLREIKKHKNKILCINHQLRFSRIIKHLKKINQKDNIKSLKINHQTNHSFIDKRLTGWWSSNSKGGGQVFALGSHFIDLITFIFGKIKVIKCKCLTLRSIKKNISEDYIELKIKTFSNCKISIKSNSFTKKREVLNIKAITGSGKNYISNNLKTLMLKNKSTIVSEKQHKDVFINANLWRICLYNFLDSLYENVKNKKNKTKTFCELNDAIYNQKIIMACFRSNKIKKSIHFSEKN
jgi:predicted dehydrogenase